MWVGVWVGVCVCVGVRARAQGYLQGLALMIVGLPEVANSGGR